MEQKSNYRYDIAMLRLFSIIVIVFFHAYGMTYIHFSEETNKLYANLYEAFNQSYLINLAMPMFIVISGYLFGGQLIKNKFRNLKGVVIAKFKRLMIPYFVFTLFFMLTTNSLGIVQFYRWAYWHLWFLPVLFECFIFSYLLKKVLLNRNIILSVTILVIVFLLATFGKFLPPIFALHNITLWFCWFVLGIKLFQYLDTLFNYIKNFHLIGILLVGYVLLSVFFYREYGSFDSIGILTTILGLISFMYIFHEIPWHKVKSLALLMHFSSLSFGIYIYHNWIEMYMVSNTAKRLLNIESFASQHEYIYPLLFSLTALIISILLTKLTLKFKFGRFLLG